MLLPVLNLIAGAALVMLPLWRIVRLVIGRRKVLVVLLVVLEFLGIHLVVDPLVPGDGIIYVHATGDQALHPSLVENLRLEIMPVRFDGHRDSQRMHSGPFDDTRKYSTLVAFNWGESYVFLRVYDVARRKILLQRYVHISPYVRVGLYDKHIYLDKITSWKSR